MTAAKKRRPPPQSKTSGTRLQAAKLRRDIVKLRVEGKTVTEICEQLGCGRATVQRHVEAALKDIKDSLEEPTAELRALELARLDRIWAPIYRKASRGKLGDTDRALKISERRSKLMGLDAPLRYESSGPGGGPIKHEHGPQLDLSILTDREFRIVDAIFTRAERRHAASAAEQAKPA